jgi:NTE family protein/lysophospholipid hydrolase
MPTPDPVASLLRNSPAFAQLSEETCARIAALTGEHTIAPGEFLVEEGDPGAELFLVVSGTLQLTQRSTIDPESEEILHLGSVGAGEVVGELSLLTGQPRPASMQATETTVVRTLGAADFDRLCVDYPEQMAATVTWMTARLDRHQIATAMEENRLLRELTADAKRNLAAGFVRVNLQAGEMLFREGEQGDALYLILSGRMRILHESAKVNAEGQADSHVLGDLGKGDLLGELAMLTGDPRSASAVAIRDTHLARLDKAAYEALVNQFPAETMRLFTRHLAARLRERNLEQGRGRRAEGRPPVAIAVLPLNPSEQAGGARDFACELVRQLSAFGPTLHLNREVIKRVFPDKRLRETRIAQDSGRVDEVAERRMLTWLDDLELLYRHIVYEADYQSGAPGSQWTASAWTERCLRQADVLLVVAGGASDPRQSEQTMHRLNKKALPSVKTTLVLVHENGPGSVAYTSAWKQSLGIEAHEHIRRNHSGDIGRIARALNRQSVGLALGGGFALGLAHIGVIDAMRELDIPIDYVGGTSMGAIIAAACAQEFTHDQMLEVMDQGCAQALKGDYTLPIVSLLTGRKVGLALGKYLEKLDIEDLWLPYFSISASLVQGRMVVHRKGSALRSVLASCRAPGMFPPLSWNGDVLVDGGLVNNIPADVMRESVGGGTVFAADVSGASEFTAGDAFGTELSGWRVARHNFNPFRKRERIGTIADVLARLIRLGGVAHKQQIRASADFYMSVPLEKFSVRDFARGDEMSKAGYHFALKELKQWLAENGRPWQGSY